MGFDLRPEVWGPGIRPQVKGRRASGPDLWLETPGSEVPRAGAHGPPAPAGGSGEGNRSPYIICARACAKRMAATVPVYRVRHSCFL